MEEFKKTWFFHQKHENMQNCKPDDFRNQNQQFWYFQNKFISENIETFSEISPQKTLFVKVHLKQYWQFWRVTIKQYYTH